MAWAGWRWKILIFFHIFKPHQNLLSTVLIHLQKCFISKTTYFDRETSYWVIPLWKKGQRKNIKIITTNFTQRSKLVDFFQTKFSNIIFKHITDVHTTFQKLFQRRDFLMVFVWMAQRTGMHMFPKHTKLIIQIKTKNKITQKEIFT